MKNLIAGLLFLICVTAHAANPSMAQLNFASNAIVSQISAGQVWTSNSSVPAISLAVPTNQTFISSILIGSNDPQAPGYSVCRATPNPQSFGYSPNATWMVISNGGIGGITAAAQTIYLADKRASNAVGMQLVGLNMDMINASGVTNSAMLGMNPFIWNGNIAGDPAGTIDGDLVYFEVSGYENDAGGVITGKSGCLDYTRPANSGLVLGENFGVRIADMGGIGSVNYGVHIAAQSAGATNHAITVDGAFSVDPSVTTNTTRLDVAGQLGLYKGTNYINFPATNTPPVSAIAPVRWITVTVDGTIYRMPLYL